MAAGRAGAQLTSIQYGNLNKGLTLQQTLKFETTGRGTIDITEAVAGLVAGAGASTGLCHLFCRHTSASLMICENADPDVRADLERWFARHVPDGDVLYVHDMEGPDDMPAHVRSILTGMDLTIPITAGRLNLGTWQGLYLYEHRTGGRQREVVVTLVPGL